MGERARELTLLVLGDIGCFFMALWLTLVVRYLSWPTETVWELHLGPFILLTVLWVGVFYLSGLYDKHTTFLKSVLFNRIINAQLVNVVLALVAFFSLPLGIEPKTNLIIYFVISSGLLAAWRLRTFPRMTPRTRKRAVLLASGKEAVELVDEVNNNDRYNYTYVRLIDAEAAQTDNFKEKLLQLLKKERIDIVVVNPHDEYVQPVLPILFEQSFLSFKLTFLDFYDMYESTFDKVPLSAVNAQWFITHVSQSQNVAYDYAKRTMDVVCSFCLAIVCGLFLPFVYIAIKIEGKQPGVFMTQDRIGQNNTSVNVLKLQTMTTNDRSSGTWTKEDEQKGNEITRVGAVLRKLSLDEVPQVWNIIKGDMSLIGPRNDIRGLGERLAQEIPFYYVRNLVKPGVTGWAQTHQQYMGDNISPQSLDESKERLAYDLYYVKHRSFLLDIEIALRTFKVLVSRFGLRITRK